jgi:ABC-type lipoprotein release transport system permease subunit
VRLILVRILLLVTERRRYSASFIIPFTLKVVLNPGVSALGWPPPIETIRFMLYDTRPLDPAVYIAVTFTLLMVATLACVIPAWRASRLDPMKALRGRMNPRD